MTDFWFQNNDYNDYNENNEYKDYNFSNDYNYYKDYNGYSYCIDYNSYYDSDLNIDLDWEQFSDFVT